MAKDNLFLGMARGSVGDVVFSRLDGVQVSRSRNRHPRNPRTPLQILQRVVMSTVGKAYKFFSPLADHSYEGATGLQGSQRAFVVENVGYLRDKLASVIAYPTERNMEDCDDINFSLAGDVNPCYNQYVISKGSLPSLQLKVAGTDSYGSYYSPQVLTTLQPSGSVAPDPTYQEVCDGLGCQAGDQLTSVALYIEDGGESDLFVSLQYSRLILMPSSGDMSAKFIVNGALNLPNERNTGSWATARPAISLVTSNNTVVLDLSLPAFGGLVMAAGCVILSRQDAGGMWLRSTERLLRFVDDNYMTDRPFGDAYLSHKSAATSSLYLNQAENF